MKLTEILRRATPDERRIIWDRVYDGAYADERVRRMFADVVTPTGPDLRALLAECRVDRPVLVLCLARERSEVGLRLLERTAECRVHRDENGLPPWMRPEDPRHYDRRVLASVAMGPVEVGTPAHRRSSLYIPGLTVDQLVRRGIQRYEVRRDAARGRIELEAARA